MPDVRRQVISRLLKRVVEPEIRVPEGTQESLKLGPRIRTDVEVTWRGLQQQIVTKNESGTASSLTTPYDESWTPTEVTGKDSRGRTVTYKQYPEQES